jgi:hypothetical protein
LYSKLTGGVLLALVHYIHVLLHTY